MSRLIKRLKQPLALFVAMFLLFGAAPLEPLLILADETESVEAILDEVEEALDEVLDEAEEELEESNEEDASEVEDNPLIEEETENGEWHIDESGEEFFVSDEDIPVISPTRTRIVPNVAGQTSPVIVAPFDEHTLSPGEVKDWIVPVRHTQLQPMMDIVYVIDRTVTMDPWTQATADALVQFTEDLMAAGAHDIHFGVSRVGWLGSAGNDHQRAFEMSLPLGGHETADVVAAIRALPRIAGSGATEDILYGYMRAIYETQWRANAQRVVIVVTDANTFIRNTLSFGGHAVNLAGGAAITNEHNILPVLMGAGTTPAAANRLSNMATALGLPAPIPRFDTAVQLERLLNEAVIPPIYTLEDYRVEARVISTTFASDGAPSTDITVEIADPASFIIRGGDERNFYLTATASGIADMDRFNDTTIVEIGFFIEGERVGTATQYLRLRVDAYSAVHQFVSADPDRDLPNEVLSLLPTDQTGLVVGTVVRPSGGFPTTVRVEDGIWTFVNWDIDSVTIDGENDVVFTGVWTFTKLTELTVNKVWNDNDDQLGMRPEYIEVQLQVNGDEEDGEVVTLDEDSDWSHIFTDLPVYDEEGEEITYTVIEINVPAGYEKSISREGNVITITNTLTLRRPEPPRQPPKPPVPPTPPVPKPPEQPRLPQTGAAVGSLLLSGLAFVGSGLVLVSKKKKGK